VKLSFILIVIHKRDFFEIEDRKPTLVRRFTIIVTLSASLRDILEASIRAPGTHTHTHTVPRLQ